MNWAARRRFFILLIIGAVVAAFVAAVGIATFYDAPSCTDNKQNQSEDGVDCGGPCAYLCTAQLQPPTVLFTKAIHNGAGRVDVIAEVENKNTTSAAKDVPYRITLYGDEQALIQEVNGTVDLPPGASAPVFFPSIASGQQTVVNAFLTISPASPKWFSLSPDPRIIPTVSNVRQSGTTSAPRVEAVLSNVTAAPLLNVRVVIIVHNGSGDVIAASSTILPVIPAQGRATATFTWNSRFSGVPASLEVVPIIPLP